MGRKEQERNRKRSEKEQKKRRPITKDELDYNAHLVAVQLQNLTSATLRAPSLSDTSTQVLPATEYEVGYFTLQVINKLLAMLFQDYPEEPLTAESWWPTATNREEVERIKATVTGSSSDIAVALVELLCEIVAMDTVDPSTLTPGKPTAEPTSVLPGYLPICTLIPALKTELERAYMKQAES